MLQKIRQLTISLILTLAASGHPVVASAEELVQPKGDVLLTVSGDVTVKNAGDVAEFDYEMLRALGAENVTTETIWTEGLQEFVGVPLTRLLEALGVSRGTIKATAINDYSVEIPVSDAVDEGPIVAYQRNGAPMSTRDKGPLWVIYPYDAKAEYQSEVIYSRSIWQLDRMEVSR